MIKFDIKSKEQAGSILRFFAANKAQGSLVFDIATDLDPATIPLVYRRCEHRCTKPGEYIGWNIWGKGFESRSTYCSNCGYSMRTMAQVEIAIQGTTVINLGWRSEFEYPVITSSSPATATPSEPPATAPGPEDPAAR